MQPDLGAKQARAVDLLKPVLALFKNRKFWISTESAGHDRFCYLRERLGFHTTTLRRAAVNQLFSRPLFKRSHMANDSSPIMLGIATSAKNSEP